MALWTPSSRALSLPGEPKRRVVTRPDGRGLVTTRQSGAPLSDAEIDYDDLVVHRSWREFEERESDQVRYMMFEVSQSNPGDVGYQHFFKAVRLTRLTRIPRWLRQQGSGVGRPGYTQMAYVLAGLREQGVLFVQVVGKTPEHPLIYAYGAQGVGSTPLEAQVKADEGHAILLGLLDGTFQQIEYKPLTVSEGEALARYSSTWSEVAMARGRPVVDTSAIGAGAILDGNRTDVEQTHNAMEAFIRGMSETRKGFLLTLVTVPLAVEDMTLAWRNVSSRLSQVRSDTHGSKSFNFGVAIPLSMGNSSGLTHGDSHSVTSGHGSSAGYSSGVSSGTSHSLSTSEGTSHSVSDGTSVSSTEGTSQSLGGSHTTGFSDSTAMSQSHGTSLSSASGESTSLSQGNSLTASEGVSHGVASSSGVSDSHSISTTAGASSSVSHATGDTSGYSASQGSSSSTGTSVGGSEGSSTGSSSGQNSGSGVNGGVLGFVGGNTSSGSSSGTTDSANTGSNWGAAATSGASQTAGISNSTSNTDTAGVSNSLSYGAGQTLGTSQGVSDSMGTSQGISSGVTSSAGVGSSMTNTAGLSDGLGLSHTAGISQSAGTTQSAGVSNSVATGATSAVSQGVNHTVGATSGTNDGTNSGQNFGTNSSLSDAYAVAMSRQLGQSSSLGVVPSFGVSVSKQTLDAAKMVIGDILEATMRRYLDGVEGGGGFLYQMYLVAEDRETMLTGSALLKSAFWGAGTPTERIAQPFHVVNDFAGSHDGDPERARAEQQRLIAHAQAFTSYRRREPVAEIIEPFMYSSYASAGELAALCRPPVSEGAGLLAVHDSAPVLAMPSDRQRREITLGRLFNGERGRVSDISFGINADELTHVLLSGVTGTGKTTTLMKLLTDLSGVTRTIVTGGGVGGSMPQEQVVPTSILAVDWMRNMRHLGSVLEPVRIDPVTGEKTGRFQFLSVRDETLGSFSWNPLAVPDSSMHPVEWLNSMADNMVASWNLGEFGRSLIADLVDRLYRANRLEPFLLRPERRDTDGNLLRDAIYLSPVDPSELPEGAIGTDEATGVDIANVYTCTVLSRMVGVEHLAVLVAAELEQAATVEGGRQGTSLRDRLQSLWRRVSYFAPGGQLSNLISYDDSLVSRTCLSTDDLVDPDRGLVTVIETDGLDLANRRFILGSLLLAVYRTGLHRGEGCFNHDGRSVGLAVVLEEAHELFGNQGEDEDAFSASTRTALYESMHRRIRALGAILIDVVQNPGDIPEAVTSNTSTVIIHRTYAEADRKRVFSLLNWSNMIGQQLREWRWLGEMPVGYAIVRLHAKHSYLESAPVQILSEPAVLGRVTDEQLRAWAELR